MQCTLGTWRNFVPQTVTTSYYHGFKERVKHSTTASSVEIDRGYSPLLLMPMRTYLVFIRLEFTRLNILFLPMLSRPHTCHADRWV